MSLPLLDVHVSQWYGTRSALFLSTTECGGVQYNKGEAGLHHDKQNPRPSHRATIENRLF